MRLTVRVPATCANLGPGFDCFGLALDLCNDVTIDTEAEPGVTWGGEGADELPTDGSDLISRTISHVGQMGQGDRRQPVPPIRLHSTNRIPLERGLGSSAAATMAGVALAYELFGLGPLDPYTAFSIAAELEGHPDNAAPAAYGGFTIVVPTDGDHGFVRRIEPNPELRPVLIIPKRLRVATAEARAALSPSVSREDAVFNAAHAALMVESITWDPSLLSYAMRDRLHQDARLALVPEARDLFDRLWTDNIPACVSGSGPALLAFEAEGYSVPEIGRDWRVVRTSIRSAGVEVLEV